MQTYIRKELKNRNLIKIKNRSNQVGELAALIADSYDENTSTDSVSDSIENVKKSLNYSAPKRNRPIWCLNKISKLGIDTMLADKKSAASQHSKFAENSVPQNYEKSNGNEKYSGAQGTVPCVDPVLYESLHRKRSPSL